ncbi:MAG: MOSC N-terminal beta barrel domain-containing protein [Solirubrobacteraceae bacterium]
MDASVIGLAITPVKAMRLRRVDAIELDEFGARGDRCFYVIDARGRMVNGKQHARLQAIVCDYDPERATLSLTFPDGGCATGVVEHGDTVVASFFRRPDAVPVLRGPWSEAVSEFIGHPLRLVAARTGVDRGRRGAASLISRASLTRFAQVADRESVDPRRFRMLIEIEGVAAHEEDTWVQRRVRVGDALLKMRGHVGRCLITSRDPDTAETDLATLDVLRSYRGEEAATEPLPFGIYGEVVEGGSVRVGDPVTLDG